VKPSYYPNYLKIFYLAYEIDKRNMWLMDPGGLGRNVYAVSNAGFM
jgi:hypothetical protein